DAVAGDHLQLRGPARVAGPAQRAVGLPGRPDRRPAEHGPPDEGRHLRDGRGVDRDHAATQQPDRRVTAMGRRPTFNLADLFEIVVDTVPDREALVAGAARRTFAELDERANRVANHLLGLGLEPGAKVAIYAWNSAEWVETFFGAFKASLVPINVNYRYVADELRYLLETADVEAIVVERSFLPLLRHIEADLPRLRHSVVLEDGGDAALGDATP